MITFTRFVCLAALAVVTGISQTATPPISPVTRTFGMVGLAEGQTARLNVLNPAATAATAAPCSATLAFLSDTGAVLKTTTVSVTPDASMSFDLDSVADLQLATDERREIRATIQMPVATPVSSTAAIAQRPACRLIPTLEIFDNLTRRTEAILARAHDVVAPVLPAPVAGSTTAP